MKASENGHLDVVKLLIEQAAKGEVGVVTLILECGADLTVKSDVVKLLIDRGAPINDKDKNGWTSLHHVVAKGQVGVVTLILERGSDLTVKSDVVKLLIDRRAPINDKDKNGWTSLHHVVAKGQVGVVTLILESGADLTVRDRDVQQNLQREIKKLTLDEVVLACKSAEMSRLYSQRLTVKDTPEVNSTRGKKILPNNTNKPKSEE
ncbi:unnamed protein product [Nezara viridula]|uniref:Uncharacterized protein n=1 Tax=Nezara viridula TaxID=85310 RepID=A0A9P0MQC5_NEZVI|nr:unnamed protein product [Nezara viridula]